MSKRNSDESPVNPSECGQPSAKRPNSDSTISNSMIFRDKDKTTGRSSIGQWRCDESKAFDESQFSDNVPNYFEEKRRKVAKFASSIDLKPDRTKWNALFDDVLNSFDKSHGTDLGESNRVGGSVNSQSLATNLFGERETNQTKSGSREAQLPQMILNPKAVRKVKMEGNPPDVLPLTEQRMFGSQRNGPTVVPSGIKSENGSAKKMEPLETYPVPPTEQCCIIERIVQRFEESRVAPLTNSELMEYITLGRPTPPIPKIGVTQSLYDHHVWVTGCPTTQRLYCWMCLLFMRKFTSRHHSYWVKEGFDNMKILGTSMTKHIMSASHRTAICNKDLMIERGLIPKLMPGGNLNIDHQGDMMNQMIEKRISQESNKMWQHNKQLGSMLSDADCKQKPDKIKVIPKPSEKHRKPGVSQVISIVIGDEWKPPKQAAPTVTPPQSSETDTLHHPNKQVLTPKNSTHVLPVNSTYNHSNQESSTIRVPDEEKQILDLMRSAGVEVSPSQRRGQKSTDNVRNADSKVKSSVEYLQRLKGELKIKEYKLQNSMYDLPQPSQIQSEVAADVPHAMSYKKIQEQQQAKQANNETKTGEMNMDESKLQNAMQDQARPSQTLSNVHADITQAMSHIQIQEQQQANKLTESKQIDLSALQRDYFLNGTFTGDEAQRKEIVASGRPTPEMPKLAQEVSNGFTLRFHQVIYERFPWICGSAEVNRLYCWPCLLFGARQNGLWNTVGMDNLAKLAQAAKFHSSDGAHLENWMRLKIVEGSIKPAKITDPARRKEIARWKQSLLKYLVDSVCFKKKLLNNDEVTHEDIKNFLTMLSAHDAKLKTLLHPKSDDSMADFIQTFTQDYTNVTVKALALIMQRKIAEEVVDSSYISFILKTVENGRVALILRFINSMGKVNERFYKIIDFGFGRQEEFLQAVLAVVDELKCSTKFVGISYDGGVFRPDQMESFNSTLRKELKAGYFFPVRGENFERLLQQSLSNSPHCRAFFRFVWDFGEFLREHPRVERFVKKSTSEPGSKTWDAESEVLLTIRDYYQEIMTFLNQVANGSLAPHSWTNRAVWQCEKFAMFFGLRETRLLLVLFSKVSSALHPVKVAFQKEFDAKYWKTSVVAAYNEIQSMRTNLKEFNRLADMMAEIDNELSIQDKTRLEAIFYETTDWVLNFIKYRTKYLDVWAYFDLATDKIDSPLANADKNQTFLTDLKDCFPLLDCPQLSTSLIFFNRELLSKHFLNKTTAEIIEFMIKYDFKAIFPELFKYLLLVQAVPLSPIDVGDPVAKRIASYAEGKSQVTSENVLLYVERDLLSSVKDDDGFHSDVIKEIVELDTTLELT